MAAEDITLRIGAQETASAVLDTLKSKLTDVLGPNGAAYLAVGAGVGAALVGVGAALLNAGEKASKLGDELQEMSQRTGVPIATLGGLNMAAAQAGISTGSLEASLKAFVRKIAEAQDPTSKQAKLFEDLGIKTKDAGGHTKDVNAVFFATIDRLGETKNKTDQLIQSQGFFGRSGQDLIPIIEGGSAKIKDLILETENLGTAFDDITAQQASDYQDSLLKLKTSWDGMVVQVGMAVIPTLNRLVNEGLLPAIAAIKDIVGLSPSDTTAALPLMATRLHGVDEKTGLLTVTVKSHKLALENLANTHRTVVSTAIDNTSISIKGIRDEIVTTATPAIGAMKDTFDDTATAIDKVKESVKNVRPEYGTTVAEMDNVNREFGYFDDRLGWVAGTGRDGQGGLKGVDSALDDLFDTADNFDLSSIPMPSILTLEETRDRLAEIDQNFKDIDDDFPADINWDTIFTPPENGFKGFATGLGNAFTEPMGKQVIQTSLISAFTDISQGGSFKNAIGGVAVAIGSAIGEQERTAYNENN